MDDNHIGLWKFNGDLSDSGSSENDLTGATIATVDYYAARRGRALMFNGVDSYGYIQNENAADFDFGASDDFSMELWCNLETGIGETGLICKWDGSNLEMVKNQLE